MQIFSNLPDEDAGVEEWRAWANEAQQWAFSMSKTDKMRRRQLKNLRKELHRKNQVFRHYKSIIGKLEVRVEVLEDNFMLKLVDLIRHLTGKVLKRR